MMSRCLAALLSSISDSQHQVEYCSLDGHYKVRQARVNLS